MIELTDLEKIKEKLHPRICMSSKVVVDLLIDSIINFIMVKIRKNTGVLSRLTASPTSFGG
jgi:hypothetical protein